MEMYAVKVIDPFGKRGGGEGEEGRRRERLGSTVIDTRVHTHIHGYSLC